MSRLEKKLLTEGSVGNHSYMKRINKYFLFSTLFFLFFSCFVFPATAATVSLEWSANQESDLGGYKVYYGTSSREYDNVLDVGNTSTCQLDVPDDTPCYIALTAYDVANNESGYSEEIVVFAELADVVHVDLTFAGEDEALTAEDLDNDVYPRMTGDVNGDGNDDLVIFGHRGVYASLSNGSGYEDPVLWFDEAFTKGLGGWSQDVYPRMLADVNGDGMADIVGFGSVGVYVALSNGTGFEWSGKWFDASFTTDSGGWYSQDVYPRMLADVNGDGMADIVGFGSVGVYVALSNGTGFEWSGKWFDSFTVHSGGWYSQDVYPRMLADVNGDGRADIVGFGSVGVYVALSIGTEFEWSGKWFDSFAVHSGGWYSQDVYPRMLADVNGDGRADIVGFGLKGAYKVLSNGTSFEFSGIWIESFAKGAGDWHSQDVYPRMLSDVNGDGRADIVGSKSLTSYYLLMK